MAKLVELWYGRSGLFRAGIVWAIVFGLIKVGFWYVAQDIAMPSLSAAHTVHTIDIAIAYVAVLFLVLAVAGWFVRTGDPSIRRQKKSDESVKVAEGVWMVKK